MAERPAWRLCSFGLAPLVLALLSSSCQGDDPQKASKSTTSEDGGAETEDESDDSRADAPATEDSEPTSPDQRAEDDTSPEPADTDTGGGPSNTGDRRRLPESLREACMSMCDAQYAVDCIAPGSSIEICDLQCVASVSNQREFCIDEYTARTQCLAEGGFECVNGYAAARSTCASETVAYSECARELPCKLYCAQMMDAGCSDDELACREQCVDETTNTDDISCASRQSIYVNCVGLQGLTCEDGVVRPTQACISAMFEATHCRNANDLCATWCEGATTLGCSTNDCVSSCEERLADATCGTDYQRMLDCGIRYGYVECTDAGLQTDAEIICDSEVRRYAECTDPPAEP